MGPLPVWANDQYVLVTSSGPSTDTILQTLSSDGKPGPTFATIGQDVGTMHWFAHPLVWTGSALGVLLRAGTGEPVLVRIDRNGQILGSTKLAVDPNVDDATLAWADDRFVVAWVNQRQNQVSLAEVTADGVAMAAQSSTSGPDYNAVSSLVASPTTYAWMIEPISGSPKVVFLDRASGTFTTDPTSLSGLPVMTVRDGQFDLIGGGPLTSFQQVDPSGSNGQSVSVQFPGHVTDVLPTDTGFRLYGVDHSISAPFAIYTMEIDPTGMPTNQPTMIGMVPDGQSFAGVGAVPRDGGAAAYIAFGQQTSFTQQLIQQCDP